MSPFAVRLGAVAGWLSLAGLVLGLIILPAMIAGQPPSSSSTPSEIHTYFAHSELAILNGYVTGFVAVGFVAFGLGLRSAFGAGTDRDRVFAELGFALLVLGVVLNLISGGIAAALVDAATRSSADLSQLLRLHDVVYDGLGDVVEGAWIGAYSVAMLGGALPRWIGWYGIALALAHGVKAIGPFVAMPAAVDMPFGILIIVWFAATLVALTRIGRQQGASRPPVPR